MQGPRHPTGALGWPHGGLGTPHTARPARAAALPRWLTAQAEELSSRLRVIPWRGLDRKLPPPAPPGEKLLPPQPGTTFHHWDVLGPSSRTAGRHPEAHKLLLSPVHHQLPGRTRQSPTPYGTRQAGWHISALCSASSHRLECRNLSAAQLIPPAACRDRSSPQPGISAITGPLRASPPLRCTGHAPTQAVSGIQPGAPAHVARRARGAW